MTTDGELQGLTVYDDEGSRIGNVGQVYLDDRTGQPEWVTVKTGLFGSKESFVPLENCQRQGDGLHIPYSKETVKEAPRMEAGEHLDQPDEARLYSHYGIGGTSGTGTGKDTGDTSGRGGRQDAMSGGDMSGTATGTAGMAGAGAGAGMGAAGMTGRGERGTGHDASMHADSMRGTSSKHDTSMRGTSKEGTGTGSAGDQSMIRSEEQLRVGTEEHESGHARLRKYVVTEHVTTTVPVSHEEVEVIREPIPEKDRGSYAGGDIGEAEVEVVLHAEEPRVSKETVAVERVRLQTEKVTEQQEVSADVQKEQVDYENDAERKGKGRQQ
ncbi:PRC and DUF2382 domain-containing protein [Streptomyces sp. ODS28]|uniref:PRC and DUF2382 domain-containing protein n=1 Tax=Streptomyces sp. ODS28 TaxID=3136688 RepID=UPI0031ED23AA